MDAEVDSLEQRIDRAYNSHWGSCLREGNENSRFGEQVNDYADLYTSLARPGWHLYPIDWRLNHVVAQQYMLPLLVHLPCTVVCRATAEGRDAARPRGASAERRS